MDWKERAKALFFMEGKSIKEIGRVIGKSEKSVGEYLKTLEGYAIEKERRKRENKEKRKGYKREWDRQHRTGRYTKVDGDSLRREHDVAAMILSREKY